MLTYGLDTNVPFTLRVTGFLEYGAAIIIDDIN